MFFILQDNERRNNCLDYIKKVVADGSMCIDIKPYKKNRSQSQNRLLWKWYGIMAKDIGVTPDELHEQVKVKLLGIESREVEGIKLTYPKSTARLSTVEMSEFMRGIEALAGELNINLPYPDDYDYAMCNDTPKDVKKQIKEVKTVHELVDIFNYFKNNNYHDLQALCSARRKIIGNKESK